MQFGLENIIIMALDVQSNIGLMDLRKIVGIFIALAAALFFMWQPMPVFAVTSHSAASRTCLAELEQLPTGQMHLLPEFKGQLQTALRRLTWHKRAEGQNTELTDCESSACFDLSSRGDISFRIEVLRAGSDPEVVFTARQKILRLPADFDFASFETAELLSSFLVGHELHPYMLGPETQHLRAKPTQALALRAFHQAHQNGAKSFLHVAPTSAGKMFNIAKALRLTVNSPERKHLSIVTVDRVDLVDQLSEAVELELGGEMAEVRLINANTVANAEILSRLHSEMAGGKHVVLTITTQSLKAILSALEDDQLQWLASLLGGLFLDEAHHFGAPETFDLLSQLLSLSKAVFYATTATPVHESVDFRSLFEVQHWSYLNGANNLFEEHEPEETFTQLRMAMQAGDITPFDELYLLGEPNFSTSESQPLFVSHNNNHQELNPQHYQRLASLISPIVADNEKGLIVTASVNEATRVAEFLSEVFADVTFEAYHSELSRSEREQIRELSLQAGNKHYLVAVRALDEGVNYPQLSTYIDLNSTLSVRQMIHRIGRVLRLSMGKTSADILFLADFKDEERGRQLLALIDAMLRLSDSHLSRGAEARPLSGPEGLMLTREELLAARDQLAQTIHQFWADSSGFLSYQEASEVARQLQIRSGPHYRELARAGQLPANMPRAPDSFYAGIGWRGWKAFLGTEWYSFEEAKQIVVEKGFQSMDDFMAWVNSEDRPLRMPKNPAGVYRDLGWVSWAHFLGTEYKSFEDAIAVTTTLGFENMEQYREWVRTSQDAKGFLLYPEFTYRNKGWQGVAHYLGIGPRYRSLEQAIEFLADKGNATKRQFQAAKRAGEIPDDIPANPDQVYSEWQGWNHFLSVGQRWMSYYEAQAFMIFHGITSFPEYQDWPEHIERPDNLPLRPNLVYRDQGWQGMRTFFAKDGRPLAFETCLALMRLHRFYSGRDFNLWLLSDQRPSGFPLNPEIDFREKDWVSWPHFLNLPAANLNPSPEDGSPVMGQDESTMYLRLSNIQSLEQFRQALEAGQLPPRFSKFPQLQYRDSWQGWQRFLGADE
jgi:superfamily II DNA or RNA helicase